MPKSLKANNPIEAEAESVPSSLRIVCDDAATIHAGRRRSKPKAKTKPALRKFSDDRVHRRCDAAWAVGLTRSSLTWPACE